MLDRLKDEFFDIRREEWPTALALSFFFFLVIAVFWVFKPIKRGLMLTFYDDRAFRLFGFYIEAFGGAEAEQVGKTLNMIVVYGVVVLFTILVRRFKRQQVVYIFCALLTAGTIIFSFAITDLDAPTVWGFYVFGDIFNSIMVASFWAFTNDVIRPQQSKRLYGLIGLGGVLGGLVGATYVSTRVDVLGRQSLLWGAALAIVAVAGIAYYVNRREGGVSNQEAPDAGTEVASTSAVFEGAKIVFQSKYLLAILGIIGLYEIVSNIVDYQLAKAIEMAVASGVNYDAAFGFVGVLTNVVSVGVQLFLTSFVMKRFGIGTALLFLPVAILMGSVAYLAVPFLGAAVFMSVSDNSLNYSINQSAKEALYTPTSRDAKYKGKAFIDMFVQRFAKVVAVGLNLAFAAFVGAAGARWLSVASIVVLIAWIMLVRFAGGQFTERAEEASSMQPVS
ncbi:hypothetical protein BSZ35_05640 [Salinibacter sp. 10B]|uniref:NTP/NDP exchange transporter n=1 Tax=Salinibacter sp. 10B TaxID=1923971 RepID=UPI000CF418DE|nr:Npt1/Npt2 family nucleotide transporter [Salinibacter sp. 10B]PQJ34152.1 hypothetical protein BSZ35_05640 [Salinibacter sp. 10B]